MIQPEILQQLQQTPLEDRIAIIEMLLQSLRTEITENSTGQPESSPWQKQPDFGSTGETEHSLGDIITPTPEFGSAKGLVKMSDDFDDPLEDFADYAP
ncbi:MAG: DUF2281 domain-containing protein [Cyanobacteria bacterium P01_H01_bin.153]